MHRYEKRVFYQDEGDQEDACNVNRHGGERILYIERSLCQDSQLRTSTYTTDPVCVELTTAQFIQRTLGSFVKERDASIVWRFWTEPAIHCPDRQ